MFLSVDGGGAGLRFAITTGGNGAEQQLTGGGLLPLNTWSHVAVTLSGNTGAALPRRQPGGDQPQHDAAPGRAGQTPPTTGSAAPSGRTRR